MSESRTFVAKMTASTKPPSSELWLLCYNSSMFSSTLFISPIFLMISMVIFISVPLSLRRFAHYFLCTKYLIKGNYFNQKGKAVFRISNHITLSKEIKKTEFLKVNYNNSLAISRARKGWFCQFFFIKLIEWVVCKNNWLKKIENPGNINGFF